LLVLRSKQGASYTADLIFALFDLDCDGRISQTEFREVYRFYLGHHPTTDEFMTEWQRLDVGGFDEVTREEYTRWLQTSANPIFRQHAPTVRGFSTDSLHSLSKIGGRSSNSEAGGSKALSRTLPGLDEMTRTGPFRARWNQNFNTKKNANHEVPSQLRMMFSRAQSATELSRYFELHRGFSKNAERLLTHKEPRHKGILSQESAPSLIPERDVPGGTMRHPISGRPMLWNDHWQEPVGMKKKCLPVTLLFQCPGKPPAHLLGRSDED
jgi:hypothetical protein